MAFDEFSAGLRVAGVTLLTDMSKCFDHVGHKLLKQEAQATNFPARVASLAIKSYRSPRRICLEKAVSWFMQAKCGVETG